MNKKLKIRDLTLRDGQQSLFATRMKQNQIDKVLPFYKNSSFYAIEIWGGAVPDSAMRYLNENPWTRLEKTKEVLGGSSKLTALSRGRNLFGYNPYPDDVIEGFCRNSIKSGIDIMRVFDALNDLSNMASTIQFVKENGGIADCCVCYTVDPKFDQIKSLKSLLGFGPKPVQVFSVDYFITKAKELEKMGADIISIKDMAGLITPMKAGEIIRKMKLNIKIPIDFHTHCTPGYGLASTLMAIINGVDIVDTSIMSFAGGSAAPAFELVQIFCNKLKIDTGVNLSVVKAIDEELRIIREELKDYDRYKQFPKEFDISNPQLPVEIDKLFDMAIEHAFTSNERKLIETTQKIENYFNFPAPNEEIKYAEIPGGMYTNMLVQLKALQLENLLEKVLKKVPEVRMDAGCPPLVTPTSQIIGVQAVNVILDESAGNEAYTNVSTQFMNLVKGLYGKTPIEIRSDFRKKISGSPIEESFNPLDYKKQENPVLTDIGNCKLAENEKEELLLELFPEVANKYLRDYKEMIFNENILAEKSNEEARYRELRNKFNHLSDDEKNEILQHGLYNYDWVSQRS